MSESILGKTKVLTNDTYASNNNCSAYFPVDTGNTSLFDLGTGDFTISIWYRSRSEGTIINFVKNTDMGTGYLTIAQAVNGDITMSIASGGSWNIGQQTSLSNGQWHQLTITRSTSGTTTTITFYIDGVVQKEATGTGTDFDMQSITGFILAADTKTGNTAGTVMNCDIADLRIWNTALTKSNIEGRRFVRLDSEEEQSSNLLGYWTFQETGSITDHSSHNTLGTIQTNGGKSTDSEIRLDFSDYALYASREKGSVSITGNSAYSFGTSAFTFSSWVLTKSGGGILKCMEGDSPGEEIGYRLSIDNNGCIVLEIKAADGSHSYSTYASNILGDNSWHHVAAVREDQSNYGYIHI